MTRIVIKSGNVTLPEAEIVHERQFSWVVSFKDGCATNLFNKREWSDSYIVKEFPTEPWSVIQFTDAIPFILDDFGNWRDPFGNPVDLSDYRGDDWVELVPKIEEV